MFRRYIPIPAPQSFKVADVRAVENAWKMNGIFRKKRAMDLMESTSFSGCLLRVGVSNFEGTWYAVLNGFWLFDRLWRL